MLIDATYFQGTIRINGLNICNPMTDADKATLSHLNRLIAEYEPEFLNCFLGESLYLEFEQYLKTNPTEPVDKWERLKEWLTEDGLSPVANYVFFHFARTGSVVIDNLGAAKLSSDDISPPESRQIPAWNQMVKMNERIASKIDANYKDYPSFDPHKYLFETINSFGI